MLCAADAFPPGAPATPVSADDGLLPGAAALPPPGPILEDVTTALDGALDSTLSAVEPTLDEALTTVDQTLDGALTVVDDTLPVADETLTDVDQTLDDVTEPILGPPAPELETTPEPEEDGSALEPAEDLLPPLP